MGACAGKHKRNDYECNRRQRTIGQRLVSSFIREKHHRPVNETTEHNEDASETTMLYDLPLEILDIILEKSYLHWILNSPTKQRHEEVICSIKSVDECFYRRTNRRLFKKKVWRYLKDFYVKTMKTYAIIRNNRKYLLENIKLNDELISSLLSLNCITQKESDLVERQHFDRDKTDELLNVMRPFNEEKLSNLVKCLRQTNQKTVARIMENGGDVIKIKVKTRGDKYAASMEAAILHANIEDLQSRTKPWSQRTDEFISQLRMEGIEILNSHLDRQSVVVWIWCHSQAALEYIQRLYESNQRRDIGIFFKVFQPSSSKVINIDSNQFKKTVVVCPISFNFTQTLELLENNRKHVYGVTKLRNEIYILYESTPDQPSAIHVFEDRNAFRLRKKIKIREIKDPCDIGSSEKDDCLYVVDPFWKCVWKIERELDDEYKIIKWLNTDYRPYALSVSSDGQLSVINNSTLSSILWIYGSDAELIRSIQLPNDIKDPHHAVTTSIGNIVISHRSLMEVKKELGGGSNAREEIHVIEEDKQQDVEKNMKEKEEENEMDVKLGVSEWQEMRSRRRMIDVVSELTSDGQLVVRRFVPSNETQELYGPRYLSLDSDDQVFLVDSFNGRVILLDSDLKWNRILLPAEDEDAEIIRNPQRLCYDDENKQLIVAGFLRERNAVNVYSVVRI